MTTKQIEIFLEVSKYGNYTKAAEKLFMSQPTVSRQISLLEDELGLELFHRGNNFLVLTQEGECLQKTFEKMAKVFEKGYREAKEIRTGIKGHLTLGFISDMCFPEPFMKVVDQFKQKYPDIDIRYVCKSNMGTQEDWEKGAIDLVFAHNMEFGEIRGLKRMPVLTTNLAFYYGKRHPLAQKKDLSLLDFRDEKVWTIDIADTRERQRKIKSVTDFYGMPELSIRLAATTNEIMFHLLLGEGVCIMDPFVLKEIPEDIQILPVAEEVSKVQMSIFWYEANDNPCIPLFCDLMQQVISD